MRIEVIVGRWPRRGAPGVHRLIAEDRGVILQARCLAKADNVMAQQNGNPKRDPLLRFGDTPTGVYIAHIDRIQIPQRTYGPHKVLRLIPQSGDALLAAMNGRDGILQHGGVLSVQGNLRPTNGCVRVDDKTQESVLAELLRAGLTEIEYIVKEEA